GLGVVRVAGAAAAEAAVFTAAYAVEGAGSDRRVGGAVIDLVVGGDQGSEGARGNVGGGAGGGVGGVVGGIGAAHGDTTDADRFGRADVLVGKTGAGVAGA